MKIPKYWAQAIQSVKDRRGRWFKLSSWRWSDSSTDEARQLALARVKDLADRVQRGETLNRYSYGERPLREETIQTVAGDRSRELGVITRNAYGALILNATQAMFIDIDFEPEGPGASLSAQLRKWSGKTTPNQQERVVANIRHWAANNPGVGIRLYRTSGGLRGLITNELFDPAKERTLEILRELKCDSLYTKLCRDQECFRARLSPKLWRCGIGKPPSRYPWEDSRSELEYRSWEEKYKAAASKYDVCRLLIQIGNTEVDPDIDPILSVHDQWCCSDRKLQLA
jgi:hypothetical protein